MTREEIAATVLEARNAMSQLQDQMNKLLAAGLHVELDSAELEHRTVFNGEIEQRKFIRLSLAVAKKESF